jgi:electron transfer flavoprotein alpha/beta subunit
MLNLVVCAKAVPDPKETSNIRIDPVTKTLRRFDIPLVLNPLDKNALEGALQIKEQLGATAYTLAKGIEKIGSYDVVLCGMASSDGSTEWVGPEIGTFLNIPVVTMVKEIVECGGEWWKVKASLENGYRLMQVKLPALFTVTRELNTPRILSFSGIIKARKKEITQWGINELGVSCESVGLRGSPTTVSEFGRKESKREVEIISGTREEKAERLVQRLADKGVF